MFDNLKKSLGRFRRDVEEQAETEEDEGATGEADAAVDAESIGSAELAESTEPGTGTTDAEVSGDADAEVSGDADAASEASVADREAASGSLADRARSLATGQISIDETELEEPLWELEMAMLENDVAMDVAEEITDKLREDLAGEQHAVTTRTGNVVLDAIYGALLGVLSIGQFEFDERIGEIVESDPPAVVIFTGVNGVGKTTTIAKVARSLEERGHSSVLANGDTFRAGANEQIEEHADRLDKELISHDRGGDPAAVIYDAVEYAEAHDIDVVLGDTAGRLHTSDDLMAQLEKIDRVVGPDLTIFVDEAVAGQDAVERARTFDEAAEIDGAVLTKADADNSGGAAISVARVTGKPILFLGVGQEYDDLERFDPEELVGRLLLE